jgi:hypothetical protein
MQKQKLLDYIKNLDPDVPLHKKLEHELQVGVGFGSAWYSSQKEHWIRWLSEYDTAGVYGRQVRPDRDSRYIYNRIMCPPMLFWLAEAAGVPKTDLEYAFDAVIAAKPNPAIRCAALRKEITWGDVEHCLRTEQHMRGI